MLEEISFLINDYRNKPFDDFFIFSIINCALKYLKLDGYISGVKFVEKFDDKPNTAMIYGMNKVIQISIEGLGNALKYKCQDIKSDDADYYLANNLIVSQILLHEIDHAVKRKNITENKKDIETRLAQMSQLFDLDILLQLDDFSASNYLEMQKYKYMVGYDYDPMERVAELNSNGFIIKVISLIEPKNYKLQKIHKYFYFDNLLRSYDYCIKSKSCPTMEYFDLVENGFDLGMLFNCSDDYDSILAESSKELSLKKRMTYGFPITEEEYFSVKKILE